MGTPTAARLLRALNRWCMVPAARAGLLPWAGTPLGGYMLLLRVRGRRSGVLRDVPLSYLVEDGCAWVMAGFGPATQWYRNLLADPRVEVWLPGRTVACHAGTVEDAALRARMAPRLARAVGAPALLGGIDPWSASDAAILAALEGIPLIRLAPIGAPLVAGPDDPGGWAWTWRQATLLAATAWLLRAARPRGGRSCGHDGPTQLRRTRP